MQLGTLSICSCLRERSGCQWMLPLLSHLNRMSTAAPDGYMDWGGEPVLEMDWAVRSWTELCRLLPEYTVQRKWSEQRDSMPWKVCRYNTAVNCAAINSVSGHCRNILTGSQMGCAVVLDWERTCLLRGCCEVKGLLAIYTEITLLKWM